MARLPPNRNRNVIWCNQAAIPLSTRCNGISATTIAPMPQTTQTHFPSSYLVCTLWLMREIRQITRTVHPGFESAHLRQQPVWGASQWQGNILFQPVLAGKQTGNIFSVISRASLPKHGQELLITVIIAILQSLQDVWHISFHCIFVKSCREASVPRYLLIGLIFLCSLNVSMGQGDLTRFGCLSTVETPEIHDIQLSS